MKRLFSRRKKKQQKEAPERPVVIPKPILKQPGTPSKGSHRLDIAAATSPHRTESNERVHQQSYVIQTPSQPPASYEVVRKTSAVPSPPSSGSPRFQPSPEKRQVSHTNGVPKNSMPVAPSIPPTPPVTPSPPDSVKKLPEQPKEVPTTGSYKGVSNSFKNGVSGTQRFGVEEDNDEKPAIEPSNLGKIGDAYDSIPLLEQTKLPRGGISMETKAVGRVQVSFGSCK